MIYSGAAPPPRIVAAVSYPEEIPGTICLEIPDMTKEAPKITARHAAMQEIATIRRCFRLFCRCFSVILRRTSAIRSS